jgi:hypothetical protein
MIIYSGYDTSISESVKEQTYFLHSYYYVKSKKDFIINFPSKIFLDSGAYSAFRQKKTIDINQYMEFISECQLNIEAYASLDVIRDPRQSMLNQRIMSSNGFNAIPCFHYNEDFKYLKRYVNDSEYIALGGWSGIKNKANKIAWIDTVFSKYCSKDTKVHGYAITDPLLLQRYSWYSVDSTTAIYAGGMGEIVIPIQDQLKRFCVSEQNLNGKYHINLLSPLAKKIVVQKIEEKGYTLQELNENHQKRKEINILFFLELQEFLTEKNKGLPRNTIHTVKW